MQRSKHLLLASVIGAIVLIALAAVLLLKARGTAPAADSTAKCTGQTLTVGASGDCVRDVQALVNLMQANKLIEACPFTGGKPLEASGTFDAVTQEQVKVIQGWVNCYNQEESLPERLNAQGTVDPETWTSLCTYGYAFPKRSGQLSSSPYFQPAMAAGADAGCH